MIKKCKRKRYSVSSSTQGYVTALLSSTPLQRRVFKLTSLSFVPLSSTQCKVTSSTSRHTRPSPCLRLRHKASPSRLVTCSVPLLCFTRLCSMFYVLFSISLLRFLHVSMFCVQHTYFFLFNYFNLKKK